MNILILYVEVMPYNRPVFEQLVKAGYSLKIIQLDKKKLTPYHLPQADGIEIFDKSSFGSYTAFQDYCLGTSPVLVMVSEVMDQWYWRLAFHFRKFHKNVPVVLGSDAQWRGSVNNWIKKFAFPFTYRQCFTHVLSAGMWQGVYALKIGFRREEILTPLYCADNELYNLVDIEAKREKYPHRFVFVGRLVPVKGIQQMLDAWASIEDKGDWRLTLIGSGEMADKVKGYDGIELLPFSSQKEICQIMQQSGCALVPSLYEPWGLVIHEAAAAGMPIIATKKCGAVHQFVVNGSNGFLVKENDTLQLKVAMEKMIHSEDARLLSMAYNSKRLSSRIMPNDVAAALVSLIS